MSSINETIASAKQHKTIIDKELNHFFDVILPETKLSVIVKQPGIGVAMKTQALAVEHYAEDRIALINAATLDNGVHTSNEMALAIEDAELVIIDEIDRITPAGLNNIIETVLNGAIDNVYEKFQTPRTVRLRPDVRFVLLTNHHDEQTGVLDALRQAIATLNEDSGIRSAVVTLSRV